MRFLRSAILLVLVGVITLSVIADDIPDSVLRAYMNAPEGYLAGIGDAKAETDWDSMTLAETRARAGLAMAIASEVTSVNYGDPTLEEITLSHSTVLTVSRSSVHIKDSRIVELVKTSDGTWWCVVYLSRASLGSLIQEFQDSARIKEE